MKARDKESKEEERRARRREAVEAYAVDILLFCVICRGVGWMEVTTSSRTAVAVGWGRTLEDKLTTLIGSSRGVNRANILGTGKKADRMRAEETLSGTCRLSNIQRLRSVRSLCVRSTYTTRTGSLS